MARTRQGCNAQPTLLIVDAQSVKNTDTAGQKGYDAGKKIPEIKRYIAWGYPRTTAEVTDRKSTLQAMAQCKSGLAQAQGVLADGGYVGRLFVLAVNEILGASVQITKRNELHTFAIIPKRWMVERSFAWLEKCRRLWKSCECKLNTSLQFIHLLPGAAKIANRLLEFYIVGISKKYSKK